MLPCIRCFFASALAMLCVSALWSAPQAATRDPSSNAVVRISLLSLFKSRELILQPVAGSTLMVEIDGQSRTINRAARITILLHGTKPALEAVLSMPLEVAVARWCRLRVRPRRHPGARDTGRSCAILPGGKADIPSRLITPTRGWQP
jgi:hypothetical protein